MSNPKILFMPHGNLEYSQLDPKKRGWVIRHSYQPLFDLIEKNDQYRIAFEASGRTLDIINEETPDVLKQLKRLIKAKKIEPVGSPYTHITFSNIDPEIGLITLKDGLEAWDRLLDVQPQTGWSPECSWASFVPEIYKKAGYKNFIMDADSFLLSFKEIREATGLSFDVAGHSNKNHLFKIEEYIKNKPKYLKYVVNPSTFGGLKMIFRSDMMSNLMLWYLMGATEGYRKAAVNIGEITDMLQRWHGYAKANGTYIMPYAEDAEYIGTTAYFYVKQFGQARFFESEPESVTRFKEILDNAIKTGFDLSTPSEIIKTAKTVIDNPNILNVENGVAWHGGTAKAWANTVYSRMIDPVSRSVFDGVKTVDAYLQKTNKTKEMDKDLKIAMKKVIASYVSDSRWPPAPTSPGRFNVREALDNLMLANVYIGKAMVRNKIAEKRALYSPGLMTTQIGHLDKELMAFEYFGEKK